MLSSDRLLSAARLSILQRGAASDSARAIAALAGVSPSAINYNFGGLEHLFGALFEAELAEMTSRAGALLKELEDLPAGPVGAAMALAHVVRRWTSDREGALLYAEARARPASEAALGPRYARHWRSFWSEAATRLKLPVGADMLLHAMFEAEALFHLSRWRPALEDAALADLCACLVRRFIDGGSANGSHRANTALRHAVSLVERSPDALSGEAGRMARVALRVIGEKGLSGLTHRAVASGAGVTAGAVAHYFRTAESLLAGALGAQIEQLLTELDAAAAPPLSAKDFSVGYMAFAARPEAPGPLNARRTLFLATVRDRALAASGAAIRFAQGATAHTIAADILAEHEDADVIAGVLSRLSSSVWHACAAGDEAERLRLAATIANGIEQLAPA